MHKFLLSLFALTFALSAAAQNSVDATHEYYQRQYVKVYKAYLSNPDDVAAHLDLARFFSQSDNPMRNIPLAMEHLTFAEDTFRTIISDPARSKEGRRLIKQNINIASIRNLKQHILALAHHDVDADSLSPAQQEAFIASFSADPSIARKIKQQRLAHAFAAAKEAHSVEAYYHFLTLYPATSEAEAAEAAIASLAPSLFSGLNSIDEADSVASQFPDSPSLQRQAEKAKSRIAFDAAKQKHSLQGYRDFISLHSSGDEYPLALEALDLLRQQQFHRLKTPQEYADFIAENSDDPLAEKAMEHLRKMVADHDAVAAKIYLDRFPLDPQHTTLFKAYYDWISAEGNAQPIASFAQQYPNYPFPDQITDDLRRAASIDAFSLNTPFAEANFASYASFIRMNSDKHIAFVALQRSLQHLCAQRKWKEALARMESLELAFDNATKKDYSALHNIISHAPNPRTKPSYESSPSSNILHPVPHPDGKRLFFSLLDDGTSVICSATLTHKKKGPQWSLPSPVRFLNVENKDLSFFGFYDNGNAMVLGHNGDIWFAVREGDAWRVSEMPASPLNTDFYEGDASMLPDGSGLLFASDRPSGYNFQPSRTPFHGDTALATDLYFIPRTSFGWGSPVNLGPRINTCFAERSPILSRNLKTLYFVSDGHPGMGYGDIFMAQRDDVDSWTSWSSPVHIGREANSGFDEASVAFSPNEDRLFVASNANNGRYGCYSVGSLHDTLLNHRLLSVNVAAFHGQLNKLDICEPDNYKVRQTISFPSSDTLSIPLSKGRRYVLFPSAHDYFSPAVTLFDDSVSALTIPAFSLEQLCILTQPLPLPLVSFLNFSSQLDARSATQLDYLVQFLKDQPLSRVILVIDVSGAKDEAAFSLAKECGLAVRRYLVGQGIPLNRVGVAPYGNTNCRREKSKKISLSLKFSKMQ